MLSFALALTVLTARPDVILVTIDTLRADRVGAYGSTRGASPTMDALALSGVVVQEAVVQVPLTRPSHASLMTGLLPFEHGIRDNSSPALGRSVPTLASAFKAAGYATAAFIGAYPVSRGSGLDSGFDAFDDPFVPDADPRAGAADRNERPAREVVDAALAFLSRPATKPRFVWIHLFEPHYPYEPRPPFDRRFASQPYDGEVATADAELKRVFDAAPAGPGRLVVVTSDHGEGLGDHGEDEHHLFVYDSTLRVPLILAGGDLPRGGRIRGQFRSIDLMPTILDLAGVTPPRVTGVSRASNLKSGAVIPDNESYAESLYGSIHFGYAPVRALRAEGFKYIDTPRAELYRVASDAGEVQNLGTSRAPLAQAMQKRLRQLHGEDAKQAVAITPVDQATQERLAALGYVAGGPSTKAPASSTLPDPKDRVTQYARYSRAVNAALLARRRREPEGVVKALAPLAGEFASNVTVSTFLGEALLETGRFKEAIPVLSRARDASPLAWARWGRLAEALAGAGRLDEALDATEKGLAVARATDLVRLRTALLTQAGRTAEALKFLESASASSPNDGLLVAELASLRRNSGDLRAADALSARAIALAPNKADAWLSRGLVLGASGRVAEAGQAFEKATVLDPRSADAWFYAATVEIQKGNGARALEFLGKTRALEPRRAGLEDAAAAARAATVPRGARSSTGTPQGPQGVVRLLMFRFQTRAEAAAAIAQLGRGEDIVTAARTDLGEVRPGDLRPPLNTAAAALALGAVSPVIEMKDGFVILKRVP